MTNPQTDDALKDTLLDAALPHVVFDGWNRTSFEAAIRDAGLDPAVAHALCPRGAIDLAIAFHRRGDRAMVERAAEMDLSAQRYRDRIMGLVRLRIEVISDKEAARRAAALFALPLHAADGAKLIWDTSNLIWRTLGDTSEDINWYTKRATLSAVYSATFLFWLGDETADNSATWDFLDRRIEDVMQIEKLKAKFRENPLLKGVFAGPLWMAGKVRAPRAERPQDVPGYWENTETGND